MADTRIAIGVDVGGSGIKVAAVDTTTGQLLTDRLRVATPNPSTPEAVCASITRLVKRVSTAANDTAAPVGVGIPSVVIGGVSLTAANIDKGWEGFDADSHLTGLLKRDVTVLNDADAAGLAEIRFGAGKDVSGVVLLLTLGTGVGSGLFVDGELVPNTELGHMEIRGRDAERRSAAAARVRRGLSWKAWANDLDEHLHAIDRILWPGLIILGGGVSKRSDRFIPRLTVRPPVVPAQLQNDAGIVGAAMAAAEKFQPTAASTPRRRSPGGARSVTPSRAARATAPRSPTR
jgi:polyphosphate glucokinase